MLIAFDNSVTDRQLLNEFHLRFDGLKGKFINPCVRYAGKYWKQEFIFKYGVV